MCQKICWICFAGLLYRHCVACRHSSWWCHMRHFGSRVDTSATCESVVTRSYMRHVERSWKRPTSNLIASRPRVYILICNSSESGRCVMNSFNVCQSVCWKDAILSPDVSDGVTLPLPRCDLSNALSNELSTMRHQFGMSPAVWMRPKITWKWRSLKDHHFAGRSISSAQHESRAYDTGNGTPFCFIPSYLDSRLQSATNAADRSWATF